MSPFLGHAPTRAWQNTTALRLAHISSDLRGSMWGGNKENYKGENKKDSDKIKLYFIQHVGALSSQLLQLQLSLSNEMSDQLLNATFRKRGCSIALLNSSLLFFALSFIYLLVGGGELAANKCNIRSSFWCVFTITWRGCVVGLLYELLLSPLYISLLGGGSLQPTNVISEVVFGVYLQLCGAGVCWDYCMNYCLPELSSICVNIKLCNRRLGDTGPAWQRHEGPDWGSASNGLTMTFSLPHIILCLDVWVV